MLLPSRLLYAVVEDDRMKRARLVDSRPAETRRGAHPAATHRISSAFPPARQSVGVLLTVLLVRHQSSFVIALTRQSHRH